jgi:hypothetical protein
MGPFVTGRPCGTTLLTWAAAAAVLVLPSCTLLVDWPGFTSAQLGDGGNERVDAPVEADGPIALVDGATEAAAPTAVRVRLGLRLLQHQAVLRAVGGPGRQFSVLGQWSVSRRRDMASRHGHSAGLPSIYDGRQAEVVVDNVVVEAQ